MCNTQDKNNHGFNEEGKLFTFKLDSNLAGRIEKYLESPNAKARFKGRLINLAIKNFLDREEIISSELDKVRLRIEEIL